MRIAVSSSNGLQDSPFSPRFGRCAFFLIFDTSSTHWEKKENPARDAQGGAGTKVVQILTDWDVDVLVSGRYGPNAFSAIKASGITPYKAESGSPKDLVDKVLAGELTKVESPSGKGFHG